MLISPALLGNALSVRPGQDGTWITSEVVDRYTELHKAGHAHSVEAWDADGNLAGGLYGVDAGGVFCGESMFFRQPNASKLALLYLIDHMKQKGNMARLPGDDPAHEGTWCGRDQSR